MQIHIIWLLQKPTDLDLHCLQRQVISGISRTRVNNWFAFCSISLNKRGWLGAAKVSCILCHRGVQLILAYSWARPAILVAGKGREVMFLFLLFLLFHSCSSFFPVPLFHLFCYLLVSFLPFSGRQHKMTHKGWRAVKPQHKKKKKKKKKSLNKMLFSIQKYWYFAYFSTKTCTESYNDLVDKNRGVQKGQYFTVLTGQ